MVQSDQSAVPPRWRYWPVLAMFAMAAALLAVFIWSQFRRPIHFGYFRHPPLYGVFDPMVDVLALWAVPAGLLLTAVAWIITAVRRVPTWVALTAVVLCGVALAAAIAVVRGETDHLWRGISTSREDGGYYTTDLHFVYEYGVRGFVERHPELNPSFYSYNSRTHPAGIHLVLYVLFRSFGAEHALRIATAIALVAMCAAGAAWLMGRTLGGERAGRIAAVLFASAPGPLLLAYTGMDAIYALFMATAAGLFVLAIHRGSAIVAAAGGVVLGVGTFLTYATTFIALAATIAIIIQTPSVRRAALLLGSAAAGGAAVLLLTWLVLGFDLWAAYQASPPSGRAYDPYWIVASPAACLTWAGLPIAALGVAGLIVKVPGARRPVLPIALALIMVGWAALPSEITKLRPGEVERTWAFLYPILAGVAAVVVDRWIGRAGRWSGAIVATLVAVSVGQTVLLQALWDNLQ